MWITLAISAIYGFGRQLPNKSLVIVGKNIAKAGVGWLSA